MARKKDSQAYINMLFHFKDKFKGNNSLLRFGQNQLPGVNTDWKTHIHIKNSIFFQKVQLFFLSVTYGKVS